jgi:hypothetical protein
LVVEADWRCVRAAIFKCLREQSRLEVLFVYVGAVGFRSAQVEEAMELVTHALSEEVLETVSVFLLVECQSTCPAVEGLCPHRWCAPLASLTAFEGMHQVYSSEAVPPPAECGSGGAAGQRLPFEAG